jgi:NADP-dependent 3-hydroxy acid dehydrogenase YdfG
MIADRLDGNVALVTGASAGLGAAISMLAEAGADVASASKGGVAY